MKKKGEGGEKKRKRKNPTHLREEDPLRDAPPAFDLLRHLQTQKITSTSTKTLKETKKTGMSLDVAGCRGDMGGRERVNKSKNVIDSIVFYGAFVE